MMSTKVGQTEWLSLEGDFQRDPVELMAMDVLEGLSEIQKYIPSRYFYDDAGSKLFEKIMGLPEYYLTNAEDSILRKYAREIVHHGFESDNEEIHIVELGAGNGEKTKHILEACVASGKSVTFTPIDISRGALEALVSNLAPQFPDILMRPMVCDYLTGIQWLHNNRTGQKLVLFLGSNVGNFSPSQCTGFFSRLWSALNTGDSVLTGFDLKKEVGKLLAAYNDSAGVTREFNLNLLRRLNEDLKANFDPDLFEHYPHYNPTNSAMESYLVSRVDQKVNIGFWNREFYFEKAEAVRTEFSFKFTLKGIHEIANRCGYNVTKSFLDDNEYFVDSLWAK